MTLARRSVLADSDDLVTNDAKTPNPSHTMNYMSDSDLIDWEQLSMIFGEDETDIDDDMTELFQEFVEDGTQRFEAIQGASFADQKEYIAKESHKLKGSASNFGFAQVANLLGLIEDGINTIQQDEFESNLRGARANFERCVSEVTTRYPALKS